MPPTPRRPSPSRSRSSMSSRADASSPAARARVSLRPGDRSDTRLSRRALLALMAAAGAAGGASGARGLPILRAIPSSKETVPVIGLGTWQTFDVAAGAARAPLRQVLQRFVELGGRIVDS